MKKIYLATFALLTSSVTWAQDNAVATANSNTATNNDWLLMTAISLLVFVCILMLVVIFQVTTIIQLVLLKEEKGAEKSLLGMWWQRVDRSLTDAIPLEKEETIMFKHSYDGIHELDNHLPPWWLYLFYGTVVFSIVYMINYHVLESAPLSTEEYNIEVAEAQKQIEAYQKTVAANLNETNVTMVKDDASINSGKDLFVKNCATCHGQVGEGGTGPNLTDAYWIHGGTINDVFKTVKYGVPKQGMIAWQKKLTAKDMQNVSSYIITLQGTNPPNAKEPQGEKMKEK